MIVLSQKETDPQEFQTKSPVKSVPFVEDLPISPKYFDLSMYGIQKHILESDQKLLSLGLFPFEEEFISYKELHSFKALTDQYP